jgi:hypothetical protein
VDKIFLLACFFLPFENFFFAPSAGWAAITPLIFFVYLLLNINYLGKCLGKYYKLILVIAIVIVITLINILFMNQYAEQAMVRFVNALISLGLGIITLFSLDIYFLQKGNSIKKMEKVVLVAYSITFAIGVVQFIAIKFNVQALYDFFAAITKRNYLEVNRVQYFFTEPSFIGMHMFGVLLPIYILGKNKKIRNIIILYIIASVMFGCGVRILIDTLAVIVCFLFFKIDFKKVKNMIMIVVPCAILFIGANYVYQNNVRVQNIVSQGVYADGSFASRWFRINASVRGYMEHPLHMLVGYGLGQEVIPLKYGYYDARNDYRNSYMSEVIGLENGEKETEESVSFCLYIRIISECGGIVFLIFVGYLVKLYKHLNDEKWKGLFFSILYLYIQFEPFAFYSIWLLVVFAQLNDKEMRRNLHENISIKSPAISRN